MKTKEIKR